MLCLTFASHFSNLDRENQGSHESIDFKKTPGRQDAAVPAADETIDRDKSDGELLYSTSKNVLNLAADLGCITACITLVVFATLAYR